MTTFPAKTNYETNTQLDIFQQVSNICALVATVRNQEELLTQQIYIQEKLTTIGKLTGEITQGILSLLL